MLTILVTGGAGYIGSHVVKELLHQGYQPIVFDNLQTGHRKAVKNALFIEGDLSDTKRLRETLQSNSIEAVLHFAADCLVGESVCEPTKYFKNNVINALELIEILEAFKIRKFVFSSSAAVYGEPKEIPISERHPCVPTNPYGETKWIFEKVLHAFYDTGKLDSISLRYFNAAGADPEGELGEDHSQETHLIPLVIKAAMEESSVPVYGKDYNTPDGTCVRDYIHVTDLADAHILALRKLEEGRTSGVFNLGNGNGYSVREVIETVKKVTGKKVTAVDSPRRPGDPARLVASSERITKELGWIPKYPDLEAIVETAYRWHRDHPKGYNDRS
ncbi:MAG TPA: UDP-glucose 4-epimerase GalE [Thermodesulfobacteriota bacterium]|jgi:UDP-glucose 4-epimerase|nr:UDP-glucose 4-epimerase GalE [Thermodesulfobacteriota bacterium]